MMNDIIIYRP